MLTALLISGGCAKTDIFVPYDAPLRTSRPVVVRDPFVRIDGEWVQKKGTVVRPAGQVMVELPATRPAVVN